VLGRRALAGKGGLGVQRAPLLRELVQDGDDARSVVHQRAVEIEDDDGRATKRPLLRAIEDAPEDPGLVGEREA
jgi:hypothetical protein